MTFESRIGADHVDPAALAARQSDHKLFAEVNKQWAAADKVAVAPFAQAVDDFLALRTIYQNNGKDIDTDGDGIISKRELEKYAQQNPSSAPQLDYIVRDNPIRPALNKN